MKKIGFLIILSFCISIAFGQNSSLTSIRLSDGFMHINNEAGAYYTITIQGDSIKQTDLENIFIVDKQIIQITSMSIPAEKLDWRFDMEKEVKLLQFFKDEELDYMKDKVFKTKNLNEDARLYINAKGKTFLFWSYDIPKSSEKPNSIDPSQPPIVTNLFMTCVCNNKVVGINCPITAAANRKKKEAAMAKIADNLIVFGDKIDVNALSYKILCKENNERFVYVDSANHFKVKVPDWLNITQTPNTQNWGGTMYDHTNLMNGILIVPFSKKQFKSLDEVERYYITNNQTDKPTKRNPKIIWQGHQAVEKPYNCNGTAFELRYTADGVLYKCKYLLYETTTAYLLAMYTATDKLYYTDIDKFNEFLEYLFPSL